MRNVLILSILLLFTVLVKSQNTSIKEVTISDIKQRFSEGNDTVYIVNFWATWCKPCVEEMPVIENIQETYKNKPVKVLLVSLDFPNQVNSKLIPFIKDKVILNEVVLLNESNPNEWIPKVSIDWSGAIPACWFSFKEKKLFHEGQVTPEIINDLLNSLL